MVEAPGGCRIHLHGPVTSCRTGTLTAGKLRDVPPQGVQVAGNPPRTAFVSRSRQFLASLPVLLKGPYNNGDNGYMLLPSPTPPRAAKKRAEPPPRVLLVSARALYQEAAVFFLVP